MVNFGDGIFFPGFDQGAFQDDIGRQGQLAVVGHMHSDIGVQLGWPRHQQA